MAISSFRRSSWEAVVPPRLLFCAPKAQSSVHSDHGFRYKKTCQRFFQNLDPYTAPLRSLLTESAEISSH